MQGMRDALQKLRDKKMLEISIEVKPGGESETLAPPRGGMSKSGMMDNGEMQGPGMLGEEMEPLEEEMEQEGEGGNERDLMKKAIMAGGPGEMAEKGFKPKSLSDRVRATLNKGK